MMIHPNPEQYELRQGVARQLKAVLIRTQLGRSADTEWEWGCEALGAAFPVCKASLRRGKPRRHVH